MEEDQQVQEDQQNPAHQSLDHRNHLAAASMAALAPQVAEEVAEEVAVPWKQEVPAAKDQLDVLADQLHEEVAATKVHQQV